MRQRDRYRPAKTLAEKRHRMFSAIISSLALTAAVLLVMSFVNVFFETLPRL